VYGSRGDVGVTTVASSLARAFRSLGSENVAHAELDPRVVRARPQSSNGGNDAERIAIPGLNAALVRHDDAVWMLAMTRPRTPAVGDAKSVTVALDAMRGRFPVSVAELEHQVNERTLAAFDAADRILLVTEGAVPSLRGTQRVLRLCRRLNYPDEKMCVVVNRFDAPDALPVADI
jgi:pilus assembly protein CpaE